MKILLFILGGAVLGFLILATLFHKLQKRTPGDLQKIAQLLSEEWQLLSWSHQPMGWLCKLEARARRFEVNSHRGDVEILECVGSDRRIVSPSGPKSPAQIYELLTKAVS